MKELHHTHSVSLNLDKCVGCTNCIKRCPTEAIRVRDGVAHISEGRCIDCGECIRVCPHHAKSAITDPFTMLDDFKYKAALIAPSLYAQFGPPATRRSVMSAIKTIGFDDVYEVAIGADVVTAATIRELTAKPCRLSKPVISSACPVVVRLIQMKYPGLIDNLLPYDAPMEVTAKMARKELAEAHQVPEDQIGIFFISPCPAKRTAVKNPYGISKSNVDGVIAISDAYPMILSKLEKMDSSGQHDFDKRPLAASSGIRWASIGGESVALNTEQFLAVDGIHNVIAILEEIENERLRDVEFIEANSCIGGCIGGPLTVANRYSAKTRLTRYTEAARLKREQNPESIFDPGQVQIEKWTEELLPNDALKLDTDIAKALDKYETMCTIEKTLPGLDCGACGAPDCAALAEDIVRGEATETDCIFKLKEKIRSVAAEMSLLESEMTKHSRMPKEETNGAGSEPKNGAGTETETKTDTVSEA